MHQPGLWTTERAIEVYRGGPEGRKLRIFCDGKNHYKHIGPCNCEQMKDIWPLDIGARNGTS